MTIVKFTHPGPVLNVFFSYFLNFRSLFVLNTLFSAPSLKPKGPIAFSIL